MRFLTGPEDATRVDLLNLGWQSSEGEDVHVLDEFCTSTGGCTGAGSPTTRATKVAGVAALSSGALEAASVRASLTELVGLEYAEAHGEDMSFAVDKVHAR